MLFQSLSPVASFTNTSILQSSYLVLWQFYQRNCIMVDIMHTKFGCHTILLEISKGSSGLMMYFIGVVIIFPHHFLSAILDCL